MGHFATLRLAEEAVRDSLAQQSLQHWSVQFASVTEFLISHGLSDAKHASNSISVNGLETYQYWLMVPQVN